jgi:AraC family transcriptional regulator, dual regulator of chb operon
MVSANNENNTPPPPRAIAHGPDCYYERAPTLFSTAVTAFAPEYPVIELHWHDIAPRGEAYHVTSLTLEGRRHFHMHAHDFAELFLVDRGSGTHRLTSCRQPLSAGDLVTICPRQAHGFSAGKAQGLRYLNVAFPTATLQRLRSVYLRPHEPFWRDDAGPWCRRVVPAKLQALQALIGELALAPRDQFHIDRFLLNLVHELRSPASAEFDLSQAPPWLARACEIALRRDTPVPTVPEFVTLACRSHEHVSRTLLRCTGRTPTAFLNHARLRRAAFLLTMTSADITRIAMECHFPNLGHFYRLFKDAYGATPRRYRLLGSSIAGKART